jgi:PAS domain S-box-containing protein
MAKVVAAKQALPIEFGELGIGVWEWDIKAPIVRWSSELCAIYGISPKEGQDLSIETFNSLVHAEDRARVMAKVSETLAKRHATHEIRFRVVRRDGGIRHILSRAQLHLDEHGKPRALKGVDIDLTDATEDNGPALSVSGAFSQSVIEANPDCFKVVDLQGNLLLMNSEGLRQLDIEDFSSCQGKQWSGLWPGNTRGEIDAAVKDAAAGKTSNFEAFCPTMAGTPKWWDVKVSPVHGDGGDVTAVIAVSRDITWRKQSEERLRVSQEQLKAGLEVAGLGLGQIDYRAGTISLDRRAAAMYGLKPSEPLARSQVHASFHPDDAPDLQRSIAELLERRHDSVMASEHRTVLPGGEVRWLNVRKQIFTAPDANGINRPVSGILAAQDVTDRKVTEERLRESEEHHRALFEQGAVGHAAVEPETGRFLRVNARYCTMHGYSENQLLGRSFLEFTHPDDRDADHERFMSVVSGASGGYDAEKRYVRRDGSVTWVRVTANAVHDVQGKTLFNLVVAQDINKRKEAEAVLRAAKETFQHLVEHSPFGVYVIDADFKLVQLSDGARKIFENVDPLIGRDFAEVERAIWPEPFASEAIAIFRRTLDTGEAHHAHATTERRSDIDAVEAYDRKIERIVMPDGRFGVVCHFYDLSERQRHEQALSRSEAQLRFSLEAAEAGTWSWDAITNASNWDERFMSQYGIAEQAPHGFDTWVSHVHPDDREAVVSRIQDMARTPGDDEWQMEFRALHSIHGERWMLGMGRAARDEAGKLLRIAGLNFDITERKRGEERQDLLLHELNHRVKNTLTVVQAIASQTLRDGRDLGTARSSFLTRIKSLAGAHEILMRESWETASLSEVVEKAVEPYCGASRARFTISGPELRITSALTLALAMMLHELCTNAVKYGALSNDAGRVTISWHVTDEAGQRLSLRWSEGGGPLVAPPQQRGFGSRLIERALSSELGSEASLQFAPAGVVCTVSMPYA